MFRFSIRDLIWLTVVVALLLASLSQQAALQRRRVEIEQQRAELATKRAELEQRLLQTIQTNDRLNAELQKAMEKASR
jgi:DNA-binding transcriptional MerR regulator